MSELSSKSGTSYYERDLEKRVLWKMDCHILPAITILYLASFLDRANVGNARIAGLETDLHLHSIQFNTVLAVFFVTYILSEIPSNIILKKVKANRWLAFIVGVWGVVTALTSLTRNFTQLVVIRLLLGLCEGGFAPGVILYLSYMYRPKELQTRIGIFYSASSLSGAFGGLFASAIIQMDGIGNIAGWRWMFILEGAATAILAIIASFILPSDVTTAKFLTEEERKYALWRLRQDVVHHSFDDKAMDASPQEEIDISKHNHPTPMHEKFEWRELWRALSDIRNWLNGCTFLAFVVCSYSFAFFFPTIVTGLGYSGYIAQLHTVPPYALALVLTIAVAVLSDRTNIRGPLILILLPLTMMGYIITIAAKTNATRYIGTCFIVAGTFPSAPCIVTALASNNSGHYKKATAIALQYCLCNISGIISTFIYTSDQAPRYIKGHTIALSFVVLAWVLTAVHVIFCLWENKARKDGRRDANIAKYKLLRSAGLTNAPIGDRHPRFRFTP